jgi:hypothetical protein
MAYEQKNILVGASAFYISVMDDQGTLPSRPSLAAATPLVPTGTDWRHVGFTMDGVEISYEPDYGDVEVDQLLDSARIFKQSMRVTVNTTFAEATLENLLVSWGQRGAPSAGTGYAASVSILGGALGDTPTERSLLFIGPGPKTTVKQERVYHVLRAIQTESTAHALRRSEATGLPASFRCLPDANASGGASYGTITDHTLT